MAKTVTRAIEQFDLPVFNPNELSLSRVFEIRLDRFKSDLKAMGIHSSIELRFEFRCYSIVLLLLEVKTSESEFHLSQTRTIQKRYFIYNF